MADGAGEIRAMGPTIEGPVKVGEDPRSDDAAGLNLARGAPLRELWARGARGMYAT